MTENGKKQAGKLTDPYDFVITSYLMRSNETLVYSQLKFEETTKTDLCNEWYDGANCNYMSEDEKFIESKEDLQKRVELFKQYLLPIARKHKKILVISHKFFIKAVTGVALKNCEKTSFKLKRKLMK